ncbi:Txe/YoeB family addiction module toxin [Lentilactobacillus sp. IMAU92037]|uniref:Txe/YoeB family addiction module toxin n=1 Tax=Lentilactobacillus dabitei TaxID=2831523 RepID=UPI001C271493|nr:Txe/YoeB family addiction module toxin [Lentilactobacillus dabitei]MBU9789337.1 Txe/YoeB family addiction module toxin [Lentilactobacillus dabitei]MBV0930475.1 Txe/YoeB family addiction module toxin [Lentilactobacillus dabitei]
MREIYFTDEALSDLRYWKKHDEKKVQRIKSLLANISETPFKEIGKPELLRFDYSGKWSRRIDQENRLIYGVETDRILVYQARYHY